MLESVLATILNKILGDYIADLSSDQLSVGIWKGDVILNNLQLKPDAFEKYKIPLHIVYGTLGELKLSIPWNDLKNKPVKIYINNVHLIAVPKKHSDFDPETNAQTNLTHKLAKIEQAEMIEQQSQNANSTSNNSSSTPQNSSFVSQMITKIIDNIQIQIKNIHLRIEIPDEGLSTCSAFGISLQELSIVSTNIDWIETFIHNETMDNIYKLLKLMDFSVYMTTGCDQYANLDSKEIESLFKSWNPHKTIEQLMDPMSINAKLSISKKNDPKIAKYECSVEINELGFGMNDVQFLNFFAILESFEMFVRAQKFQRFRPPSLITPSLDPKAWFKYAALCVLSEIQERNKKWTWGHFKERKNERILYFDLYHKKKTALLTLTPQDITLLEQLDHKLSFEDIRQYRSLAQTKIKQTFLTNPAPKPTGWFSFMGYTSQPSETIMDTPQIQSIYTAIEKESISVASNYALLPSDALIFDFVFSVKLGNAKIQRKLGGDVIVAGFEGMRGRCLGMKESMRVEFGVDRVEAFDKSNQQCYPYMVKAKDIGDGFLRVVYEDRPIGREVDHALSITMLPLEVVLNPQSIKELCSLFVLPKSELETLEFIKNVAMEGLSAFTTQTRSGLEYAIEMHKTLDLQINIGAPIILFPGINEQNTTTLMLDAGHLIIESNIADKSILEQIKNKSNLDASELERLTDLLYDRFKVSLRNVKLIVGDSILHCLDTKHDKNTQFKRHIIENVDIDFNLEVCILSNTQFTQTIIKGQLPLLGLNISQLKYQTLMKTLENFVALLPGAVEREVFEPIVTDGSSLNEEQSFYDCEEELPDEAVEHHSTVTKSRKLSPIPFNENESPAIIFKFDVEKLSVLLEDSVSGDDVASLTIDSFAMSFEKNSFESTLEVFVQDIVIQDKSSANSGQVLLSTAKVESKIPCSQLISLSLLMIPPSSPKFSGTTQEIIIAFSNIELTILRDSILGLHDFVLTTFAGSDQVVQEIEANSPDYHSLESNNETNDVLSIVFKCSMESAAIRFDRCSSIRLATLKFEKGALLVNYSESNIHVEGKMREVSLFNDKAEGDEDKFILSNQGDHTLTILLDVQRVDQIFNSKLFMKTGSINLKIVDESLIDLIDYMKEFSKMHSLYERARIAASESATRMQSSTGRFSYQIQIASPSLEFKRSLNSQCTMDRMKIYLGNISLDNTKSNSSATNVIDITKINIISIENNAADKIVQDVDCHVEIAMKSADDAVNDPSIMITVGVSDIIVKATKGHYIFINDILQRISLLSNLINSSENLNSVEGTLDGNTLAKTGTEIHVNISLIRLILFKNVIESSIPYSQVETKKMVAEISLLENGGMTGNVMFSLLDFLDVKHNLKSLTFEERISSSENPPLAVKFDRDSNRNAIYIIQIDRPRLVPIRSQLESVIDFVMLPPTDDLPPGKMSVILHITGPIINVPRDISIESSDTLVMTADDMLMTRSETGLKVELKGFCSYFTIPCAKNLTTKLVEKSDITYVSIIESGFTISSTNTNPILIRISYKESLLFAEMLNSVLKKDQLDSNYSIIEPTKPNNEYIDIREKLKLTVQIRVILIDDMNDLHLPMLDVNIMKLICDVTDQNIVSAGVDMHINYFNVRNSTWEPLLESWHFVINTTFQPDFEVDFFSNAKAELNITNAFLEIALNAYTRLYQTHLKKNQFLMSRELHDPYIIQNKTGYTMHIWKETNGSGLDTELKKIKNGTHIPWRFHDMKSIRETFVSTTNTVSLQITGPPWESLKGISIDAEGRTIYILRPKIEQYVYKIVCEVVLRDNIKYVTFKSPFIFVNQSNLDLELTVLNNQSKQLVKNAIVVSVGEEYSVPIEFIYNSFIKLRPYGGRFQWSNENICWRNSQKNTKSILITCLSMDTDTAPFIYHMSTETENGLHSRSESPTLTIKLLPPIEIENLTPFDIYFWIKNRTVNNEEKGMICNGTSVHVYAMSTNDFLALAVDIPDAILYYDEELKAGQLSIINNREEDYRDEFLVMKTADKIDMMLKINYNENCSTSGLRVSIYAPYVVLNKTGMEVFLFSSYAKTALPSKTLNKSTKSNLDAEKIEPFMYSYGTSESLKNRTQVRVSDSDFSKPISFEAVGTSFDVVIPSTSRGLEYQIGINIKEGEGKYHMTKIVTISPRYMIYNQTNVDLEVKRKGASGSFTIKSSICGALMYTIPGDDMHQLSFRVIGLMNEWSTSFKINQVGRVYLKLGMMGSTEEKLLKVEVTLKEATVYIVLQIEKGPWPFRIDNTTDTDITIYQQHCKRQFQVLKNKSRQYAWDNPAAIGKSLMIQVNGKEREIDLLEIGHLQPLKYSDDKTGKIAIMDIYTCAEGPSIIVCLKPYNSLNKSSRRPSDQEENSKNQLNQIPDVVLSSLKLKFEGIGISLVNRKSKEILYLTLKGFSVAIRDTAKSQHFEVSTRWIQIDNQIHNSTAPIMLYPSVIKRNLSDDEFKPVLLARLSRSKDASYGVEYYQLFTILLQEFSIDIDDQILGALFDFVITSNSELKETENLDICNSSLNLQPPEFDEGDAKMYFETLLLHPMQINLTYSRTGATFTEGERYFLNELDLKKRRGNRGVIAFATDVLTMTVGNIHEAPIRANALELYHPIVTFRQLIDLVIKFYTQEVMGQLHNIIGSADFLGNPVGLFNNVSSGVSDLFYEPLQGFEITRPQDFGIGIAKGTASLVKKTLYGVTDTFSKFTGSVGKGLSVITMDEKFQERRRVSRIRNRPKHAGTGVTEGAASFARSVASGITGIVVLFTFISLLIITLHSSSKSKPMEGAERNGISGFFSGLGKGIVGVIAKPVIGVFDLASNVTEGIKNTTTVFDDDLDRQRLPRHIGSGGVLKPYSYRDATGLGWMKTLENGKWSNSEYISHLDLKIENAVLLVTDTQVMIIKVKRLKVLTHLIYDNLQRLLLKEREITFIMKVDGEIQPFTIVCPTKKEAEFITGHIESAFVQYLATHKPNE